MKKAPIILLAAGTLAAVGLGAAIPFFNSRSADMTSGQEVLETSDSEDTALLTDVTDETPTDAAQEYSEPTETAAPFTDSPNMIIDELTWITPEECEALDMDAAFKTASEKKPEDYNSEAVRELAKEYTDKGITIYDLEYMALHGNLRICSGEYAFINGFMVEDDDYNEVVAAATQEEFDQYLDNEYNANVIYTLDSEEGSVKIYKASDDYNDYTLSYDSEKEVFICHIQYRVKITGGVG